MAQIVRMNKKSKTQICAIYKRLTIKTQTDKRQMDRKRFTMETVDIEEWSGYVNIR